MARRARRRARRFSHSMTSSSRNIDRCAAFPQYISVAAAGVACHDADAIAPIDMMLILALYFGVGL